MIATDPRPSGVGNNRGGAGMPPSSSNNSNNYNYM